MCAGAPIGFSRTGGSTINVIAPDATCRVVGELLDQGSGLDDLHRGRELVRAARSAAEPARRRPSRHSRAPMVPVGHTNAPPSDAARRTGGRGADRDAAEPCDVGGPAVGVPGPAWILYPGLYPGGLGGQQRRDRLPDARHLLDRRRRARRRGRRIDRHRSGPRPTRKPTSRPLLRDRRPPTATLCGGVMFYNSKLPTSGGRSRHAQLECGDDEARVPRRADRPTRTPSTRTSSSSRTGPSRPP